jgi:DNA-binding NarL/FixJ family response regulator
LRKLNGPLQRGCGIARTFGPCPLSSKVQVKHPVLLVEDSQDMQDALQEMLASVGDYEVVAAFGMETSATDWLLQHPGEWRLAVIDLLLREGSGFSLIQRCRKSPRPGQVVVLSDFVTPVVKARCLELGADAVFTKNEAAGFAAFLEGLKSELEGTTAARADEPPAPAKAAGSLPPGGLASESAPAAIAAMAQKLPPAT